jgi:voltage-gated potassium channel
MLLNPADSRREMWDFMVLALTLYVAIETPLRIALGYSHGNILYILEITITIFFTLDIIINFNTGIKKGTRYITDKKEISKIYFKKRFFFDLIAMMPLFLLSALILGTAPQNALLLRLMELNRLFKLHKLNHLLDLWRKRFRINPGTQRLMLFGLILSLVAHWIACGWIIIGGVGTDSTAYSEIYSLAIYWTVTTMTTVGYGDITPHGIYQRLYAVMVMIVGAGSYGYVIGNISSLLANMDIVKAGYRKKLEEVSAFLNYRSIPPEMQLKVQEYYEHIFESHLGNDESSVLDEIPDPLRSDLALYMRQDLIKKVPFFVHAQEELLKDLVMSLKPRIYLPGSYIIKKNETGSCMYIISSGQVDVISEDEKDIYATLQEGSFVGEMALVLDMPRTATVKTREYCDVYILEKNDFDLILKKYPDFARHIEKITRDRLEKMHTDPFKDQLKNDLKGNL